MHRGIEMAALTVWTRREKVSLAHALYMKYSGHSCPHYCGAGRSGKRIPLHRMTSALLEKLHRLKLRQEDSTDDAAPGSPLNPNSSQEKDEEQQMLYPRTPHSHDGYGFKNSGSSTFQNPDQVDSSSGRIRLDQLIPDPNGLGWPGKDLPLFCMSVTILTCCCNQIAKSTVSRLNATVEERLARERKMASAVRTILECIGEDPDREGLLRTPERYAQAIMWMTRGYEERLADVINDAIFAEDHDEMVLVRDIEISSLCEHHLVPFIGKVRQKFV
ncbi:hypothetical protein Ac2012v2_003798 [Leucoagaricus gongylophorus]